MMSLTVTGMFVCVFGLCAGSRLNVYLYVTLQTTCFTNKKVLGAGFEWPGS